MEKQIGYMTSLLGDPVRTTILWSLLDSRAYTATELALSADTSPQNISMHLGKLVQAGLLSVESQGRHKYYRLASPDVAYAIEAIANLVPKERQEKIPSVNDSGVRYCRTCYDHLAGKIGVAVTESLVKQKLIAEKAGLFEVTAKGNRWFTDFGIDMAHLKEQRRTFLRPCLDWSERKYHLAGALGAAVLDKLLSAHWIRRTRNSRAIIITAEGQHNFHKHFNISV